MILLHHIYLYPTCFEVGILTKGRNLGITFAVKMAENNELTNFELKCCIIDAIKEQHVHIYDKSNLDHFNRAKCEASFKGNRGFIWCGW